MTPARDRQKRSLQTLELQLRQEQAFLHLAQELLQRTNQRIMDLQREKQALESTDTRD